jgi:hypothetical protein
MTIHHYTKFETLFAILESKKIRFKRLDKVDDPSEAKLYQHKKFAKSLFTSSWTTSFNSPCMWEKYGDNGFGVIISFPVMMFNQHEIRSNGFYFVIDENPAFSPLPPNQNITDRYIVTPVIEWSNFFKKVQYVKDLNTLNKKLLNLIEFNRERSGTGVKASSYIRSIQDIARYKESKWSYQDEYRYVLQINLIRKYTNHTININDALIDSMNYHFDNNYSYSPDDPRESFTYIDVPIAENAFKKMDITFTSKLSKSRQELIKELAIKHQLKFGVLDGSCEGSFLNYI